MLDDFRLVIIALILLLLILVYAEYEMSYINQVQETVSIQYSKPYVKFIKNSSEYIVTVRTIIYASSSTVYVEPFLVNPSSKSPALKFQGNYVNQIFDPDEVGYVNVTGVSTEPTVINGLWYNAIAFQVPTEKPFNVTFTTNQSYALMLQVYVSTLLVGYQEVGSIIIPLNYTINS